MKIARNAALALAAGGIVITTGIVGYAAIPGADGQVKGCYATKHGLAHSKGDVRIVDSGEACRSYERAITWSQRGPKGVPGAPGTNGTNGSDGIDGTNGVDGADGTDGVSGYELLNADTQVPAGSSAQVARFCPTGKVLVGATAAWFAPATYLPTAVDSHQFFAEGRGQNTTDGPAILRLSIYCINAN